MEFKTEKKIKRFLESLSDEQVRKLFEDLDVSPFPFLIMMEHEKRFGKKDKKIISVVATQLRQLHNKQNKLLREIKTELKNFEQLTLSISGLEKISKSSIEQIHSKRSKCVQKILKLVTDLEKTNKSISLKEADLENLRKFKH